MNQGQPRNKMRMRSVNISKAISVLVALLVLRLSGCRSSKAAAMKRWR